MDNRDISTPISDEVLVLIDDLCNGTISPEGTQELEAYLIANPQAQDFFIAYCQIQIELNLNLNASVAFDSFVQEHVYDTKTFPTSDNEQKSSVLGFLSTARRNAAEFFSQPFGLSLLLALFTITCGIITLALIYPRLDQEHASDSIPKSNPKIAKKIEVARLTGQIDCVWGDEQFPKANGQSIYSDSTLRLDRGLAEITYNSGVRVILQAPAVLDISSSLQSRLRSGKISAVVPPSAKNFTIHTQAAKVVDIGTEFSVQVGEDRHSLVHVFQGVVDVYSNNKSVSVPSRLRAGESLKISIDGKLEENLSIDQEFIRPKQFAAQAELPITDQLHLWLKADAGVQYDTQHRVTAWIDQSANQYRFLPAKELANSEPTFVSHSWSTRPTVYFNGKSNMLTSVKPISLFKTNRSGLTAFLVFKTKNNQGQKMILDQSFSTLQRTDQNFELGYDVGRKQGAGNFGVHRGSMTATVAPENTIVNQQSTIVTALILNAGTTPNNVRIYKNGNLLNLKNHGRDDSTMNNQGWLSAGQYVTDVMPIDIGGRDPHGKRKIFNSFHHGDIAEIIIYRKSLNIQQRDKVEQHLKDKWF